MSGLLAIDTLTGGYHDTNVVFDVSVQVAPGQVLGLFGRNGVGKTTLARLVQGGLRPATGDIRLGGRSVTGLAAYERRALGLGYMPQTGMVFDDMSVRDNLYLGENRCPPDAYFDRFPRLAERLDQKAGSMSGGERKILAFVRTMIEDTGLLVLDEPSEGVQPENIDHMADCLKERARDGAGIILIEQNMTFLTQVADSYLGLDAGRVCLRGDAGEVTDGQIKAALAI
ncbi:ATP-binding cassette domain-containing protein [Thalassovita aquimarina]|uniref:ATP-binding cassette domain-containing protein n=1 Tax=Thalassovita aquimarina TaxID=2785917 RepID=A0ABS5HVH5_9RHOB|nr:ATP-binding cassette domain-containing protein [Thalassovita aquimarina]MBR9652578.1 ATP-binding cassette domain-containing protein [Thalassovita aquimarina]